MKGRNFIISVVDPCDANKPYTARTKGEIMASVQDTILAHIRSKILPGKRVDFDTRLITNGFVNSLEMVAVKTYLETHYSIRIPDDMATRQAFDSVENITRLLSKLGVR
jgi:acyl carrier protein